MTFLSNRNNVLSVCRPRTSDRDFAVKTSRNSAQADMTADANSSLLNVRRLPVAPSHVRLVERRIDSGELLTGTEFHAR